MSNETKLMSGIVLLTVPSIIYGGFFLLQILSGRHEKFSLTAFQRAMFRAGHAHAGVLVMLSLIILLYVDQTQLSDQWKWMIRISFPLSAILVSGGFFGAAAGKNINTPGRLIILLYAGIIMLVTGLLTAGIGLIKS
ncbi:MAG: hypothetical protein IT249_08545 [Chitinophagaceae bacterium]|nr:hypothetical protein [Chitinophagaceae bacterium]